MSVYKIMSYKIFLEIFQQFQAHMASRRPRVTKNCYIQTGKTLKYGVIRKWSVWGQAKMFWNIPPKNVLTFQQHSLLSVYLGYKSTKIRCQNKSLVCGHCSAIQLTSGCTHPRAMKCSKHGRCADQPPSSPRFPPVLVRNSII